MAIIESTGTSVSRRRLLPKGARQLADAALERCLERAGRSPTEIDLLVNAGIYREKNLAEPALASMIQEDVGANPGHPSEEGAHGTFSFDVANGACGVITALELVDGLMESKVIEVGAVVASDSDPGNVEGFPFPAVGGAILLRPGPAGAGFSGFTFETFPELAGSFESVIAWHEKAHPLPLLPEGRNVLEIHVHEHHAAQALECATAAVRRALAARELTPDDVDLLVAGTYPSTFAADLARDLGIAAERVAVPDDRFVGAHTAGVIASLDAAIESGRLFTARNALLVAVGAGITVATAFYRHAGEST